MFDGLGEKVELERYSKRWTRKQLADKVMELYDEYISEKTIQNLEEGGGNPTAKTIALVLGALRGFSREEVGSIFDEI